MVFHGEFASTIERILPRLEAIKAWFWVDDGVGRCPSWATPYQLCAGGGSESGATEAPWGRSGHQLYLLYTGGTTGKPKGVMWRQDDLFRLLNRIAKVRFPENGSLDDVAKAIIEPGPRFLPACPIMHGTGALGAFGALSSGGAVVTLPGRSFDVENPLDTVDRVQVQALAIVGDVFARPMVKALDEQPGRWTLTSLKIVASSGVMWSPEVKRSLLRHVPGLILADSLGSSEAIFIGSSVTRRGEEEAGSGRFVISSDVQVLDHEGRPVQPGTGEVGQLAVRGYVPLGYYKDPQKSASTFREIDGTRFSIPGDFARVEEDGSVTLLGRGSNCINTGGEKVFPEEVEEVIKQCGGVEDAAVVGIPDPRFGEAIVAIVQTSIVSEGGVISYVRGKLAPYKVPRSVILVSALDRAPNGKLDYPRLRRLAIDRSSVGQVSS